VLLLASDTEAEAAEECCNPLFCKACTRHMHAGLLYTSALRRSRSALSPCIHCVSFIACQSCVNLHSTLVFAGPSRVTLQVQAGDGLLCKRATGPDLNKACKQSCASACTDALARYEARMFAKTGFKLEPKERERVLRNCRHSCSYECTKSGKAHDFVVPYRR
jgi:hypothetical protein